MGKRLGIAALLTTLLVCLGFVLQSLLWVEATPLPAAPSPAHGALQESGSVNSAPSTDRGIPIEIQGVVEYRSGLGAWQKLGPGAELDLDTEVRTGRSSMAKLRLGPAVTVELAANTSINIAQLSATLSRVRLQDGRVVSEVEPDRGMRFRVQVQGSDAEAETNSGRFAVMRADENHAVVAAEHGRVAVSAAGRRVHLETGEQTIVAPGVAPSPPMKLPPSLVLKLARVPPSRMRDTKAEISGETAPGARVSVGRVVTSADGEGRFTSRVALVDGPNEILVEVHDVLGRKNEAKLPRIVVDAQPPTVKSKVIW